MLTFGSDPEFFIVNDKNKIVPAHSVNIPHVSEAVETEHGAFFRDGWALELNPKPSENPSDVYDAVLILLNIVQNKLPKGYYFSTVPCTNIDLDELKSAPADVQEFGCNPAYDAYEMRLTRPSVDAKTHPLRSLSGHLHFSGLPVLDNPDNYPDLIKLLDLHVGLPISVIFSSPEQYQRRGFYGKAGEFRIQRYQQNVMGLEYRTLDARIYDNFDVFLFALNTAKKVLTVKPKWDKGIEADLREAINNGDEKLQQSLMKRVPQTKKFVADFKKRIRGAMKL